MKTSDIYQSLLKPGVIVGLGESSHGSATEFKWRSNFILNYIKQNHDQKFKIFLEAYKEPFLELSDHIKFKNDSPKKFILKCLNKNYKILQTQEMSDFMFEVFDLISNKKINIQICGVDFDNEKSKKAMNQSEMLAMRNRVMYKNIKDKYQQDALHFYMAHNLHVGKYNDETEEVGSFLAHEFKDKYINVAQHVSKGKIRAKSPDGFYSSVEFEYKKIPCSLTNLTNELFGLDNNVRETILFDTKKLEKYNVDHMEQAGFLWPMNNRWTLPLSPKLFDFVVLHKESVASEVLN